MESLINSTPYKTTIAWLSEYIKQNPSVDLHFRTTIQALRQEGNHYVKCVLLDNRYLYASFLDAARERLISC